MKDSSIIVSALNVMAEVLLPSIREDLSTFSLGLDVRNGEDVFVITVRTRRGAVISATGEDFEDCMEKIGDVLHDVKATDVTPESMN